MLKLNAGVIALYIDSSTARCEVWGSLVPLRDIVRGAKGSGQPHAAASEMFSQCVELDPSQVAMWDSYDDGVVPSRVRGLPPVPADRRAGDTLAALYEHIIREVAGAHASFILQADRGVTWAVLWQRPLAASSETLFAHRWAFTEAMGRLDEDDARFIAVDDTVCEAARRLSAAVRAGEDTARRAPSLVQMAHDLASRWVRADYHMGLARHALLPDLVDRPRDLGFLGTFATGALAEAWHDAAEWAGDTWLSAVMDEATVRARAMPSPYRIERGLLRFVGHRSTEVAREQAKAEWRHELPRRVMETSCDLLAGYVSTKTDITLAASDLLSCIDEERDFAGPLRLLREDLPARMGFALADLVPQIPWKVTNIENDTVLERSDSHPWVASWDQELDSELHATYREAVDTLFLGCGQEMVENLGSYLAALALICLRRRCEEAEGVPGASAQGGSNAVWTGGAASR